MTTRGDWRPNQPNSSSQSDKSVGQQYSGREPGLTLGQHRSNAQRMDAARAYQGLGPGQERVDDWRHKVISGENPYSDTLSQGTGTTEEHLKRPMRDMLIGDTPPGQKRMKLDDVNALLGEQEKKVIELIKTMKDKNPQQKKDTLDTYKKLYTTWESNLDTFANRVRRELAGKEEHLGNFKAVQTLKRDLKQTESDISTQKALFKHVPKFDATAILHTKCQNLSQSIIDMEAKLPKGQHGEIFKENILADRVKRLEQLLTQVENRRAVVNDYFQNILKEHTSHEENTSRHVSDAADHPERALYTEKQLRTDILQFVQELAKGVQTAKSPIIQKWRLKGIELRQEEIETIKEIAVDLREKGYLDNKAAGRDRNQLCKTILDSAIYSNVENRAKRAEHNAARLAKPENRAKRAEYNAACLAKPENRAKRAEYNAAWRAKPENRAKQAGYNAAWQAKKADEQATP